MQASSLRQKFLDFFEARDHTVVRSASLIPHDPSLLFTVAGMVPFKSYFLGEEPAPYKRAVSVQKCVRAGGKHNDLNEVGRTAHHLTFFEMLGNFSFGDYFKAEAIDWGWQFSTEVLGFDPQKLWITVHTSDTEAEQLWQEIAGVPADRIQKLGEDNYWRMGDVGPCGPCSELYFDKGEQFGHGGGPAGGNEERYVEFWNLVFMQFSQDASGQTALPNPSIDTGAGLERLLALLQGVTSVFEIDEMQQLLDKAAQVAKTPYGKDQEKDVWLRILAEHSRTMAFLISDGVFPSNEDRGYVLRRIMRRAIRHAHLLGADELVCPELVDEVVAIMGQDYPDLAQNHPYIREVVAREEERFRKQLSKGTDLLHEQIRLLEPGEPLSGQTAFMFHDTYGFPVELVEEVVAEQGVSIDRVGFDKEMSAQRARARKDRQDKAPQDSNLEAEAAVLSEFGPTDFIGRFRPVEPAYAKVLLVTDRGVILDRTPFYAESGGQVGDIGTLKSSASQKSVEITDTTYVLPGLQLHHTTNPAPFEVGETVLAEIDNERRESIRRHHTGTHLLHWALREVVGNHITQQGSFVGHDHLRFDFSHFQALTPQEVSAIEDLVNSNLLANEPVAHFEKSYDEAKQMGALSFFGDKYGDRVLVLEAGSNSLELCGGTHVEATGDIGLLKIVSESSIGANIRRVEGICGSGVMSRLRSAEANLLSTASILGTSVDDLAKSVQKQRDELKDLRDELRSARQQGAQSQAGSLVEAAEEGVVAAEVSDIDRNQLRDLAIAVRQDTKVKAVILGAAPESGGVALVAAVKPDHGLHASEILSPALKLVQGGGAQNPELAAGGGKDASKLSDAIALAKATALHQLGEATQTQAGETAQAGEETS